MPFSFRELLTPVINSQRTLNLWQWTMREWTIWHDVAGMEFIGVDKNQHDVAKRSPLRPPPAAEFLDPTLAAYLSTITYVLIFLSKTFFQRTGQARFLTLIFHKVLEVC